jgi:TolB-like protein
VNKKLDTLRFAFPAIAHRRRGHRREPGRRRDADRNVSRELGVYYILTGSTRRKAEQMRATAELTDPLNGKHLDSYSHDGDLKDIFDVRNQLTL